MLWISGDTVLYDGVREVADRLRGRHRAPAPRRRALPGDGAAALHDDRRATRSSCAASSARARAIPIHYEGWKHFREGRERDRARAGRAPEDVRRRVRWLPIGEPVDLAA